MKKIIVSASVACCLMLSLSSCGGHSTANKEQISNATVEAEEMLDKIHAGESDKSAAAAGNTLPEVAKGDTLSAK